MKIYNNFSDFVKVSNAIVTIGTFDGVHLGHQAILKDMVKTAKNIGGETVVITFYPHPRKKALGLYRETPYRYVPL